MYLDALFINMVHQRWPNLRKPTCGLGLLLVVVALIASSFATKVWHLILTQGVMYALGGSMLYYPMLLFLDEWFVRKKGIAFGIMWVSRTSHIKQVPFLTKLRLEQELEVLEYHSSCHGLYLVFCSVPCFEPLQS